MTDVSKPLYTLRFHQMRLSVMSGAIPFFVQMAQSLGAVFYIPVIIALCYIGHDLVAIFQRKSGVALASKLIYKAGNADEYDQIMKAVQTVLGIWFLSLVFVVSLVQNNAMPIALRIIAVLVSNVISLAICRWLLEVWQMIADYKKQKKASRSPSLAMGGLRPFSSASVGQATPQYVQPQPASIRIRKGVQP